MKPFREIIRDYLGLFAAILFLIGCGAVFWAWMNLVGVPLQERSTMDSRQGWISVGIAVVTFSLAYWLSRRRG